MEWWRSIRDLDRVVWSCGEVLGTAKILVKNYSGPESFKLFRKNVLGSGRGGWSNEVEFW